QDRPAPAPRFRPRQAAAQHRCGASRRRDDRAERADRRGHRGVAGLAASDRRPRGGDGLTVAARLSKRSEANARFFDSEAERLARVCHLMAERFARGGRLIAFGRSPAARSDARHVAVEFVHPVIGGKRALPAIGLAGEGGDIAGQAALIAAPDDVAMGFGADCDDAIAVARGRGCLTIAFTRGAGAEWEFEPPTSDPSIGQELIETLYHVLWELVHVFFE